MGINLKEYISQQRSVNVPDDEIRIKLINSGWDQKEVISALSHHPEGILNIKTLLISLTVVCILILIVLTSNIFSNHTYDVTVVDPSITEANNVLFKEIESQELALHSTLHEDLGLGKIPISKELSILFRVTDLLHMQSTLMRITDEINDYQHSGNQHKQSDVNKRVEEIKVIQARFAGILKDTTHGGELDPNWSL